MGVRWASLLYIIIAVGCRGAFTSPPPPDEDGAGLPRCGEIAAPLTLDRVSATVAAGQVSVFTGAGGTGRYRFALEVGPASSDGEISPETGVYVAGRARTDLAEGELTTDIIRLEDRGCRGEARATVTVVEAAGLTPAQATVEPNTTVELSVVGPADPDGGRYVFDLATDGSGAEVTARGNEGATYVAGTEPGRDVVRLTDTQLGTTADAVIQVVSGLTLSVRPSAWVIPVGTEVDLPLEGSTSGLEVTVEGTSVEANAGGRVTAIEEGTSNVTFLDPISRSSVTVSVDVTSSLPTPRRTHEDTSIVQVVSEAFTLGEQLFFAAGNRRATGRWLSSGVVTVYAADGTPAVVLSGASRVEEYGSAVDVGDLTGDGVPDLLVGARRADPIRRDVGAVYVYSGVDLLAAIEAGDPEDHGLEPVRSFYGTNGFDLFGDSLAVCDFNQDGQLDLAVGAPFAQEAGAPGDQGIVHVFIAYSDHRFISTADVQIPGEVPGEGAIGSLRLGEELAAGDFDGDGACDLGIYGRGLNSDQLGTGYIAVHRGISQTVETRDGETVVLERGGLEATPARIFGRIDGMPEGNRVGESFDLGDVNGDGRADLLVGSYLFDCEGANDCGALQLWLGDSLDSTELQLSDVSEADWTATGARNADQLGRPVSLHDVNGDGRADLVSGAIRAGVPDSDRNRPGTIYVWFGGEPPSAEPDRTYEGPVSDIRFGAGGAAVGDLNGDGESDVVGFAPFYEPDPEENTNRGGIFRGLSTSDAIVRISEGDDELAMPYPSSGQLFGRSVAMIDLAGDGSPEVVVGAAQADIADVGPNAGVVRIYAQASATGEFSLRQELFGFPRQSNGDEVGWIVDTAGDFDGDGRTDLAVLARSEDLPATLDAADYEAGPGCTEARNNSAAVLVFRGLGDGTVDTTPAFALYGPQGGAQVQAIAGGGDFNGDGLDDLLVGSRDWDPMGSNNAGGVGIFFGRAPSTDGRIRAVCTLDVSFAGPVEGARLGHSVTFVGDLDRDGCDDVAAGAPELDPNGLSNAGGLLFYLGYGSPGTCSAGGPRSSRLNGVSANAQTGRSMAGGVDADGDGVPDLIVGADQFRDSRGLVGRTYFVPGSYGLSLVGGEGSIIDATLSNPFVDGATAGETLGSSVALSQTIDGDPIALIGGPFGSTAGRVDTGGAIVYRLTAAGFGAPLLQVSGESRGASELGRSVAAVRGSEATWIVVGAPFSQVFTDSSAVDDGAAYAFPLPR